MTKVEDKRCLITTEEDMREMSLEQVAWRMKCIGLLLNHFPKEAVIHHVSEAEFGDGPKCWEDFFSKHTTIETLTHALAMDFAYVLAEAYGYEKEDNTRLRREGDIVRSLIYYTNKIGRLAVVGVILHTYPPGHEHWKKQDLLVTTIKATINTYVDRSSSGGE